MRLTSICTPALLGILTSLLFNLSECLRVTVNPDMGAVVTVSTTLPMEHCGVCTVSGDNDTQTNCHSSLSLVPDEEVTLLFNCSQPPPSAFQVHITRQIECTTDSCSPATGTTQANLFPEFSRTLTWDLSAPKKRVLGLDFPGDGLKEMAGSESCQDGYQYTVNRTQPDGNVQTQTYCRTGPVGHLDLPSQATVSLTVPPEGVVDPVIFSITVKPKPKKGRMMAVTPDPETVVTISRGAEGPDCKVCSSGEGPKPTCHPTELTLSNAQNSSLEFSCTQPQDVFSVEIKRKIECTTDTCSPATGAAQPSLFPEFNRTLTWDLSVSEKTVLGLDFPGDGLQEMTGSDKCPDGHQYTFSSTNMKGEVQTQTYCKNGPVSHLDLPGQTTVTLRVPQGAEVDAAVFTVTAKPMVKQGRTMSVTPDPETIVIISSETEEPMCEVCVGEEIKTCASKELTLKEARNTSVEFTCSRPQDVFKVEINREIDCTELACSGNVAPTESSLFPDFNRTFTWDLKVLPSRTFQLDFPEPGMRQIPNSESCLDQHTYTVVTYQRTGPATIGTYCRGGAITRIQVLYKGRVALEVPRDRKLEEVDFKVSLGQETDMLAIIQVDLPRGVSDTDFVTANYPRDFPDEQKMRWDFVVPGMHNYTVTFLDFAEPECLNNEVVKVEYLKEGKKEGMEVLSRRDLSESQPAHWQGNFNMALLNCKTNRTVKGLNLNFRVSVMRSGHPVLCTVDQKKGVTLTIEKRGSDPYCEIQKDDVLTEKITLPPGSKASLSFLDCPSEDLHLTASETLACQSLASCPGALLFIPRLDSCLPMPLHSFTWHLQVPKDGTVDLRSPKGSLHQSLPGQECNDTVSLHVAEEDGASVGYFCPIGTISKVQVHANVSVTAWAKDISRTRRPFLNVTFSEEIAESIIYTVKPKMGAPALLATPNWPNGMKDSSTVSWIISLPQHYQAELQFTNISQPKCAQRHTSIKVQTLGSLEEMLSRREDEEAEDKLLVPESFYLNMSNCIPEEGHFSVVAKITVQKKSKLLLSIILGAVGALLLLMLIVLVIVCVVIKKKKRNLIKEPSIYIGKGNIFLPGDGMFPKTRSDNESHVYASIDETMVYGHLLPDSSYGDSSHFQGSAVDSYRTFTGPLNGPPVITETGPDTDLDFDPADNRAFLDPSETFIPSRPRTPIMDMPESPGFEDRRMVDNELYTFKSTGDINTIRLSADLDPEPIVEREWDDESL